MPEGVSETEQVVTIDRSPYPEAIWARAIVARCDGIGRHPRVRELGINHLEACRAARVRRVFSRRWDGGRLLRVATIHVAGVDLFFRGKLDAALGASHRLVTAESIDPPDLVIVDIARVDPEEVADAYPDTPILGFTNHTDTEGLRRAKAAGFDRVVVRSALAERAGEIVNELVQ